MDNWILFCEENKIEYFKGACDIAISYLVRKTKDLKVINIEGQVFTHCNYLGDPCHRGQIDYNKLISCHNMSLKDFDDFTNLLLENNYFI